MTKARRAGFTLLEVMIAIGIIGMIVSLIYGSFARTAESKELIEKGNDIYHEMRWALDKMEADLSTAYLTTGDNSYTIFYGVNRDSGGRPVDELHFTSFNHLKFNPEARESDQSEVSYFVMENPENGVLTLYRREDATPDEENTDGGEFYDLAEGIILFNLRYFDGVDWLDEWDSRDYSSDEVVDTEVEQNEEMVNAMPMAVEVTIIMKGPRESAPGVLPEEDLANQIAFHTKIRVVLSSIALTVIEGLEGEEDDDDDDAGATGGANPTATTGKTTGGAEQ